MCVDEGIVGLTWQVNCVKDTKKTIQKPYEYVREGNIETPAKCCKNFDNSSNSAILFTPVSTACLP